MGLIVLFEYAIGYSLFDVKQFEDVGNMMPQVEAAITDGAKFRKAVKLIQFRPFVTAAECLANTNALSEGIMTNELEAFLISNNINADSKDKTLGVGCPTLGAAIKEALGIDVLHTGIVPEVIRGIKTFLPKYIEGLSLSARTQAELGLGHSYSRAKVMYNVNRVDNMIIQSIALNDQMDKDVNTFAMRIREWYSYHFPELSKIVEDHNQYARLVKLIGDRSSLDEELLPQVAEIVMDEGKAEDILAASRMSMGTQVPDYDIINIKNFADRVISLTGYRRNMTDYLHKTVENVAPNVGTIIGDPLTARLISKAGSLINLAKMPACTIQVLGAEKALFRAIKTKSATPKYGMLYNASWLSKAAKADKGRISRCLANKVSLASKIDCFSENLTSTFGENLNKQLEDRLKFYNTGEVPPKNEEVMEAANEAHLAVLKRMRKEAKKRSRSEASETNGHAETLEESAPKKSKKEKKKSRKSMACLEEVKQNEEEEEVAEQVEEVKSEKKKKKKKKRESV